MAKTCRECGKPFQPRQYSALFCSSPCRIGFNRRRQDRGTEVYDAFMTAFDKVADAETVPDLSTLRNLYEMYKRADHAKREGRPSWQPWQYAKTRIPVVAGVGGDGR